MHRQTITRITYVVSGVKSPTSHCRRQEEQSRQFRSCPLGLDSDKNIVGSVVYTAELDSPDPTGKAYEAPQTSWFDLTAAFDTVGHDLLVSPAALAGRS